MINKHSRNKIKDNFISQFSLTKPLHPTQHSPYSTPHNTHSTPHNTLPTPPKHNTHFTPHNSLPTPPNTIPSLLHPTQHPPYSTPKQHHSTSTPTLIFFHHFPTSHNHQSTTTSITAWFITCQVLTIGCLVILITTVIVASLVFLHFCPLMNHEYLQTYGMFVAGSLMLLVSKSDFCGVL